MSRPVELLLTCEVVMWPVGRRWGNNELGRESPQGNVASVLK